jgi:hypothetical protein
MPSVTPIDSIPSQGVNMNSIEALLGLLLLSSSPNTGQPGMRENLPVIENRPDAVIIKATSRGCTKKRHFRVVSADDDRLQVIRIKPDRCQLPPRLVEFHYSHKQMGVERPVELNGSRLAGN